MFSMMVDQTPPQNELERQKNPIKNIFSHLLKTRTEITDITGMGRFCFNRSDSHEKTGLNFHEKVAQFLF